MKINQLVQMIEDLGFIKEYDNTYFYTSNMQGCWVNVDTGNVGANLINDEGMYEESCTYDLDDDIDCYDAYVEALAYVHTISDPSVCQAIRLQHGSKKLYDILHNVAPGRFDVPSVK